MDFDVSRPIWQQLAEEFVRRIAVGEWAPGAKVPGVRELAGAVGTNPNTVQRALSELERDGLFRSERGAGRYVTDDDALIRRARSERAQLLTDQYVTTVRGLGLTRADMEALIAGAWNEADPGTGGDPA